MSEENKQQLNALLGEMREKYAQKIPGKLAALNSLWEKFSQNQTHQTLQDFLVAVHGLAGTAATFGLSQIGTTARKIEFLLEDDPINTRLIEELLSKLNNLPTTF